MKRDRLWPGAFLGMALVVMTFQPMRSTVESFTPPSSNFWECWFYPFPWCPRPLPDPVMPQPRPPIEPSIPDGCCTPECMGPCR
jgi:hypothetical protein